MHKPNIQIGGHGALEEDKELIAGITEKLSKSCEHIGYFKAGESLLFIFI